MLAKLLTPFLCCSLSEFGVCIRRSGLGLSWNYFRLAQYLDDRRVYGLQARGFDGITPPAPTLEAMVSDYINQIRTIQPEGPYHLLGWSFGGAGAAGMAAELEGQGETLAPAVTAACT